MKTSYLAFGTAVMGVGLVIVACGGADSSTNDVLGSPNNATTSTTSGGASSGASTSGTSGATTSSSGTTSGSTSGSTTSSSSGVVCAPCASPPPDGCTPNNASACDCSYTCPDSGTTPPTSCTWAKNDPCPSGTYCAAQNCGKGVCVLKPANETALNDPQCGCDGVTYWNASVASKNGMPLQAKGACSDGVQVGCGGPLANACPAGATCNRQVKGKGQCAAIEPAGTCWTMPATCNANAPKTARSCNAFLCEDECSAISGKSLWFEDGSCPN